MITPQFLLFRAPQNSNTLVLDHDAQKAGIVRYVGRRYDKEAGGFVPVSEPSKVTPMHEYRQAAQLGFIVPANKETAQWCQLAWKETKETA